MSLLICRHSDVWAYGVVLWELWSHGELPYGKWSDHKVCGFFLPKSCFTRRHPSAQLVYHERGNISTMSLLPMQDYVGCNIWIQTTCAALLSNTNVPVSHRPHILLPAFRSISNPLLPFTSTYSIMIDCWHPQPHQRPSLAHIKSAVKAVSVDDVPASSPVPPEAQQLANKYYQATDRRQSEGAPTFPVASSPLTVKPEAGRSEVVHPSTAPEHPVILDAVLVSNMVQGEQVPLAAASLLPVPSASTSDDVSSAPVVAAPAPASFVARHLMQRRAPSTDSARGSSVPSTRNSSYHSQLPVTLVLPSAQADETDDQQVKPSSAAFCDPASVTASVSTSTASNTAVAGALLATADSDSADQPHVNFDRARSMPAGRRPHPLRLRTEVPIAEQEDAYLTIVPDTMGSNTFPRTRPTAHEEHRPRPGDNLLDARAELEASTRAQSGRAFVFNSANLTFVYCLLFLQLLLFPSFVFFSIFFFFLLPIFSIFSILSIFFFFLFYL